MISFVCMSDCRVILIGRWITILSAGDFSAYKLTGKNAVESSRWFRPHPQLVVKAIEQQDERPAIIFCFHLYLQ